MAGSHLPARQLMDGLPCDECAGGVVILRTSVGMRLLMIADRYGNWTLPKGHLEPGETSMTAALREIQEETGISGKIIAPLGCVSYPIDKGGARCGKNVQYFLVETTSATLVPQRSEITAAAWFSPLDALAANFYANNRPILERALHYLRSRS